MEISIHYDRKDHQIRFLKKSLHFIKEIGGIKEFVAVQIGVDISRKILVFKPLLEETKGSYRIYNELSISSVGLARTLKEFSGHRGFYRYPIQWHKGRNFFVVDLTKGVPQG